MNSQKRFIINSRDDTSASWGGGEGDSSSVRLNIVEDEVLAAIALGVRRIYSSEGIRIDTILEKTWEHQMPSELSDLR